MHTLQSYFPNLDAKALDRFAQLEELYRFWNAQINVISRKDMDSFFTHHVLHSLAIAQYIRFKPGTTVLDVGTGGGFPGIPLAIFFPETKFHLVDSIGKKIKVVQEVTTALGLENVIAEQKRVEELHTQYDFVVSRAVAQWSELKRWTQKSIKRQGQNALPNGWLLLKGGDLNEELADVRKKKIETDLSTWFKDQFFETKKLIYIPL